MSAPLLRAWSSGHCASAAFPAAALRRKRKGRDGKPRTPILNTPLPVAGAVNPRRASRGLGLALLFLLAAVPASHAEHEPLAPGETATAWRTIHIGTDETVAAPGFTYGYVGTSEGVQSCQNRNDNPINVPVCRHQIPDGASQTWIDLRQQPIIDPDARAGVGLAYRFVPGCAGQNVPPGKPVKLTAWYERAVTVTNTGGLSYAEIWAHPTGGRGDVQTAESPPETGGTNERLELFESSSAAATRKYEKSFDTVAGEHKALVYSRAHAQRASLVQSSVVESKVSLKLHNVTFDWTDDTVPSVAVSYRRPDGSALTPINGARGGHWFRENFSAVYQTSDDFSCPKTFRLRHDPAHPWAQWDVNRNKDPVVVPYFGDVDGSWWAYTTATDHQGNTGGRSFLMGVDTTPPEPDAYVTRWTVAGRDGWYRANVDVAVDCFDATSGCWRVRSWINNGSQATHASFPAERALTSDGRYWFTCAGDDGTYLAAQCEPLWVGVDRVAPGTIRATCRSVTTGATAECVAGKAFASAQEVAFECADATSGCAELEYRLDGGAWTRYAAPFVVSTDGAHPLDLRFLDVAGNAATRSVAVDIDSAAPDMPVVATPEPYTQMDPKWDVTVSDSVGAVKEIRISVNGVDRAPIAPGNPTVRYTYHPGSQGSFCLVARAVDFADNVGPASDPACVIVDWNEPYVEVRKPSEGTTYWNGEKLGELSIGNVVIGPMGLQSEGWEWQASAPSGIARHKLSVAKADGTVATFTKECGATAWCTLDLFAGQWPVDPSWFKAEHRVDAEVTDRAGLGWSDSETFHYFHLLASGAKTPQNRPYVDLWYAKYGGDKPFLHYRIQRSPYAGASWEGVASITDVNQTRFVDWNVTAEVTYIYRVIPYVDWWPGGFDECCWSDGTTNEYPASAPAPLYPYDRRTVDPAIVAASQ